MSSSSCSIQHRVPFGRQPRNIPHVPAILHEKLRIRVHAAPSVGSSSLSSMRCSSSTSSASLLGSCSFSARSQSLPVVVVLGVHVKMVPNISCHTRMPRDSRNSASLALIWLLLCRTCSGRSIRMRNRSMTCTSLSVRVSPLFLAIRAIVALRMMLGVELPALKRMLPPECSCRPT